MRRSMLKTIPAMLLLAGLIGGCGSSGDRVSRNPNVLTQEEIIGADIWDLYTAVERLRPRWLQIRVPPSLSTGGAQIVVFLNTTYQGGPEALRQFGPNDIAEVRFLDGPRASATLQGYPTHTYVAAGIVLVTTGTD
jgi:hypothetical protein